MSEQVRNHAAEARDTIVKSSLTGVAASVLAVTIFSPAALGGIIGTSIAAGFGGHSSGNAADDVYANLPPFPAPLSQTELSDIRGRLATTTASLEITRAATAAKIERIRTVADSDGLVAFERVAQPVAQAPSPAEETAHLTFTALAPLQSYLPVVETLELTQVRNENMELADLLLSPSGG